MDGARALNGPTALVIAAALLAGWPAQALTRAEMCQAIQNDRTRYQAAGRPCACPYDVMHSGRPCGDWSAWAQPGGAAPRCYFGDVTGELPANPPGGQVRHSWPAPPPCRPTS